MSLKIGVFGYGFIAGVHVEAISHMDGVDVEAVCGPRAEAAQAFADKHGIARVVTDIDGLLEDDGIAGVLVDTPDATHHKLVMRSLAAGTNCTRCARKPRSMTFRTCSASATGVSWVEKKTISWLWRASGFAAAGPAPPATAATTSAARMR